MLRTSRAMWMSISLPDTTLMVVRTLYLHEETTTTPLIEQPFQKHSITWSLSMRSVPTKSYRWSNEEVLSRDRKSTSGRPRTPRTRRTCTQKRGRTRKERRRALQSQWRKTSSCPEKGTSRANGKDINCGEDTPRTRNPPYRKTKQKGIPRERWRGGDPRGGGTRLFDPEVEVEGTSINNACDLRRPRKRSGRAQRRSSRTAL